MSAATPRNSSGSSDGAFVDGAPAAAAPADRVVGDHVGVVRHADARAEHAADRTAVVVAAVRVAAVGEEVEGDGRLESSA